MLGLIMIPPPTARAYGPPRAVSVAKPAAAAAPLQNRNPAEAGLFLVTPRKGVTGEPWFPRFRSLPGHVTRSASYMSIPSMPPIPPMPWAWPPAFFFSSTSSATIASVVSKSPATEAAFCSAVRLTLVGSSTPISTRSPNSSVWALKPKLPVPSTILFITTEGSAPELARSEEHTSELQSLAYLVCRLLLEKKKKKQQLSSMITVYKDVINLIVH